MLLEELVKTHRRIVAIGFILLVIGCGLPGRASTQSTRGAREQILGAWQLESRTVRKVDGETLLDPVLGQRPIGRLFYDASGNMMLQMMRQTTYAEYQCAVESAGRGEPAGGAGL